MPELEAGLGNQILLATEARRLFIQGDTTAITAASPALIEFLLPWHRS